jgi:hypothetical protein
MSIMTLEQIFIMIWDKLLVMDGAHLGLIFIMGYILVADGVAVGYIFVMKGAGLEQTIIMGGVTLGYIFVKDELVLVYVISNVIERSC